MASIGLTAIAAFDAQRAVRGQNAVVDRAVREFSSFAAWSYSEHLTQQLSAAAVEVVGAVNHGENMHTNPRVPAAHELVHYLPEDIRCDCHRTRLGPNPSSFFAFKLGTRDVAVALPRRQPAFDCRGSAQGLLTRLERLRARRRVHLDGQRGAHGEDVALDGGLGRRVACDHQRGDCV